MGIVYVAVDTQSGQKVALKVLRSELSHDSQMRRRFARESAALRALSHPSIVRVVDAGVDRFERAYLVTELMHGQTLGQRIKQQPLAIAELRTILLDVCGALTLAHRHGIIHGDLKPTNLFVIEEDDRLSTKVLDFGASKILGLDRLTTTGELAGTPMYMAPELLKGSRTIDARIDIYALGIIAYEALSGRSPFSQSNPGRLLFAITRGDVQPLSEGVSVPFEIEEDIYKAMHIDPEKRFQNGLDFAKVVERWATL